MAPKAGYLPLNQNPELSITKVDVLEWLTSSTESDARWVLKELKRVRPSVVPTREVAVVAPHVSDGDEIVATTEQNTAHSDNPEGVSIIQFSSPVFYGNSDEESFVALDLIRIGDSTKKSDVTYISIQGSAIAGEDYTESSGTITFEPGDSTQQVQLTFHNNGSWNTTTELKMQLTEATNATLGQYLFETRVKIIDTSPFPTDFMKDADLNEVGPAAVLKEFFKLLWAYPPVRRGSFWVMFVDLVHNIWYFVSLFMMVYLLDYIIDNEEELPFLKDRRTSLIVYSGSTVGVLALLHVLDYSKFDAKIGQGRTFMQNAVIRKFMNYSPKSRQHVTGGDIMMAVQRDCPDLVAQGYMSCLKILAAVEKLLFMLTFKLVSPQLFGGKIDTAALYPLLGFPILLGLFLPFRETAIQEALTRSNDAEADVMDGIRQVTDNYSMIVDYSMRSFAQDFFSQRLTDLNKASKASNQILLNTTYFANWVTAIIVGSFVVYGGMQVLDGNLRIGMFVTDLNIINASGAAFSSIYSLVVEMQKVFPCMTQLTMLLNLQTDVLDRLRLKRSEREQSTKLRQKRLEEYPSAIAVDLLPIVLNLDDDFPFEGPTPGSGTSLNFAGNHEINQGQMVGIVGKSGSGKRTLLRLISGRMLPESLLGDNGVFVPAHLRNLTVSDADVFYSGTLYDNLIFGMDKERPEASKDRVITICRNLGVQANVLSYLDYSDDWEAIFSEAQNKLLNIARALINNAEVICLDKPMAKFTPDRADKVAQVLLEHVQNKGLAINNSDVRLRRPRTIFLSASMPIEEANSNYFVCRKKGISLQSFEECITQLPTSVGRVG